MATGFMGSDEVKEFMIEALTEIAASALREHEVPVPRPVVRATISTATSHLSTIDPGALISSVMATLGQAGLAGAVRKRLRKTTVELSCPETGATMLVPARSGTYVCAECGADISVHENEVTHDGACDVTCPETDERISLEHGDGTYECPGCGANIEVADGVPVHALAVACPVTDGSFWVGPEQADYECPECGMSVAVADGDARHEDIPYVKCRRSRTTILLTQGAGEYRCTDCGADIVLDTDGHASHGAASSRSRR